MIGHAVDEMVPERFIFQKVPKNQIGPFCPLKSVLPGYIPKHIKIGFLNKAESGIQVIKKPAPASVKTWRRVYVILSLQTPEINIPLWPVCVQKEDFGG